MSEPIPARGLFETHLTISDLDRSIAFYRDVVGLPLALNMPERGAAFFWIGQAGRAMLGLWTTGSAPIGLSLHVAFTTTLENVLGASDRLRALGVTPLSFYATETNEPSVIGWMPAAAVYFRDPDGHLLEYLAMLNDQPDPERGVTTWSAWNANRTRRDTPKGSGATEAREGNPVRNRVATAMSVVERIRDALPDEAAALEALQRRSSDVWDEYRSQLAANPDAIEPPDQAIAEGRVRVAVDASQRRLGFSVVKPVEAGRCELDDLFVEPESMSVGVGRLLVDDLASRAAAAGAAYVDVIANPNALGFYKKLGFEIIGDASTRFGRGVRMSLDLSPQLAR
jgi:lactoylglutathione lyase